MMAQALEQELAKKFPTATNVVIAGEGVKHSVSMDFQAPDAINDLNKFLAAFVSEETESEAGTEAQTLVEKFTSLGKACSTELEGFKSSVEILSVGIKALETSLDEAKTSDKKAIDGLKALVQEIKADIDRKLAAHETLISGFTAFLNLIRSEAKKV
jgi:hypothetical protein